jgi:hypothetical protein
MFKSDETAGRALAPLSVRFVDIEAVVVSVVIVPRV